MNSLVNMKSMPKKRNVFDSSKIKFYIFTVLSCLIIFINALQMAIYNNNLRYLVATIDIILLTFYFFIILIDNTKILVLEEKLDNIKGFQHDFSNFVQALDGYVKTNNINGIRIMSQDILKDCANTNALELLMPEGINNAAVYSIITKKYCLAKEQGIVMNIDARIDLKDINISSYYLCKILAILLDNAIEAASKCSEEKVINLRFMDDTTVKRKLIIVENSYQDCDINLDRIFEKGFSNKKDKETHGLGLWNIRKILLHKENLNLYTNKGKMFIQQLEIY